jgi:probable rRNA maturation factor
MICYFSSLSVSSKYKKHIIRAVKKTLKLHGLYRAVVDVRLVDNKSIRVINKRCRNIDAPTDCLSFPQINKYHVKKSIVSYPNLHLGDILISFDKACEQAYKYGHSIEYELTFLSIHSTLHLLGYTHDTRKNEKIMRKMQRSVFSPKKRHRMMI